MLLQSHCHIFIYLHTHLSADFHIWDQREKQWFGIGNLTIAMLTNLDRFIKFLLSATLYVTWGNADQVEILLDGTTPADKIVDYRVAMRNYPS